MRVGSRHYSHSSTPAILLHKTIEDTILILGVAAISVSLANAQGPPNACPAVGADTTCGVVITVIQTGSTPCPPQGCAALTFTGQGPYDTIEDTLVGVVNNSKLPITSLVLTSSNDIFFFDGDGICGLSPITGVPYVPAPPACPYGPTGYEGPGTSFSNISPDDTTGTVTFNPPIPANGGTAYFSLENSLTAATACSSIINGSVPAPTGAAPTISTAFTPNSGYTIAQAALLCGFTNFDWQQLITAWPKPSPLMPVSGHPKTLFAPPSFFDPPPGGGYTYELTRGYPSGDFAYPFYLNPNLNPGQTGQTELLQNEPGGLSLLFSDTPSDPCLFGGHSADVPGCNGMNAKAGQILKFQTHLVGINSDGSATDLGIGFNWHSNYNGTSGGAAASKNLLPPDAGSGTGGITVTNANEVTSYQYPKSFGVTAINGNPITPPTSSLMLLTGDQIRTTYTITSPDAKSAQATIAITNISPTTIAGPFQIVLTSLTTDVASTNASGSFGGWSYITVPSVGGLDPGQSASVDVEFEKTSKALAERPECKNQLEVGFTPVTYSGSFN